MGIDKIEICGAFKAMTNYQETMLEAESFGMGSLEAEDKREEYARLYERGPVMASDKQIDYILLLCKGGWLAEEDFPSSHHYWRKKSLTKSQAHALIMRGKKRMSDDKHWKSVARERGW